MKYSVQSIQEQLSGVGWKIVSDTYKNLNEPLTFECPEGHRVYDTWGHIRAKQICPVCQANQLKDKTHSPKRKPSGSRRVIALDQSSKITGYSIYDDKELIDYGIFETQLADEIERARQLKEWLVSMCAIWKPDYVGIEGVQYQEKFGVTTFQTLCRIQGIVMESCLEMGIKYEICPTNSWRHHCGVKGRSRIDRKRSAQLLVKKWYDISVTEDEADAIGIGKYMAEAVIPSGDIVEWE